MLYEPERAKVAATALELLQSGLVINTSGNVSIRIGNHVGITPSGCDYRSLSAADICVLDLKGSQVEGDLLPSSETPLHLAVYDSDPNLCAIVHTHSVHATAISTLVTELPAIHYQIADLGGPVPVAPYRTFGTPQLAQVVTEVLQGRSAALMQNHGSITVGGDLDQALARSVTLEWLARVYLIASRGGSPSLIDDEELVRVKEQQKKFSDSQSARLLVRQSLANHKESKP